MKPDDSIKPHAVHQLRIQGGDQEYLADPGMDDRYIAYFSREDIDGWEIRQTMTDIMGLDLVPEPEIIIAALKACRRVNDVALAIRVLESTRLKCNWNKAIWPYMMQVIHTI